MNKGRSLPLDKLEIPSERRERNPLMTEAGWRMYRSIVEHPKAPKWNFETGDRLNKEDLVAVEAFRKEVFGYFSHDLEVPPERILTWISSRRDSVALFRECLPEGFDLQNDWVEIPTMSREDLAVSPERFLPCNEDLDRLIVYDTSGTTGHALLVPHHPRCVALNHVFAEQVLRDWNIEYSFDASMVACVNVCAQRHTYVFANVFAVWNDAGFAKVNLHPAEWLNGKEDARAFLADLNPSIITADPVTIAAMMQWEIDIKPKLIISTALALSPGLRDAVSARYDCPVVDWYSTTETGPVGFVHPDGNGYRLFAPDLWVEILDDDGYPIANGELGEITVTGGRNPYLPLLRYRTGDRGSIKIVDGDDGPERRLVSVEGRAVVFYRDSNGGLVNPVDISRIMRLHAAFVQHEFLQRSDGSIRCSVRPAPSVPLDLRALEGALRSLFGDSQTLDIIVDEHLGEDSPGGKIMPWKSELQWEDI